MNHEPVWATYAFEGVTVDTLAETSTPGATWLDDFSIIPGDDTIRLGVCDPALGLIDPHVMARLSGQIALAALHFNKDLEAAFHAANASMFKEEAKRSTSIYLSCMAGIDWNPKTGELVAVRAGDCQVLVLIDGSWQQLFGTKILTDEAAQAWESAAPQIDRPAHLADHDRILGHESAWITAPLGQFRGALIEKVILSDVKAVALSTDGVRLNAETVSNLTVAWESLHDRDDSWPHNEPHGDIAVLIARQQ